MRYLLSEERCNKAHWNPEKKKYVSATFICCASKINVHVAVSQAINPDKDL
ncbi:hypothetical protein [Wolbachia sp. wLmal]|uniref:hypothetical protein n=1 Tax=Wolbachia sp. wLmal TaxID=3342489 RepID=UPI003C2B4A90